MVTGDPHPLGAGRIPADLLLLPQGLLPGLRLGAARLRGSRRASALPRGEPLPAHPPERPPLLLLSLHSHPGVPLVRRGPRVPVRRWIGGRRGNAGPGGQCLAALAVHHLLSLLPARLRRWAGPLL